MISLLLFALHPDLVPLRDAGYSTETTCPFDMALILDARDESVRRTVRVDPQTGDTFVLDDNGEPIDPEQARQRRAEMAPEENDGESVSVNTMSYSDVLERLDMPYEFVGRDSGVATYQSKELPKGTVVLNDIDLSKRSSIVLQVREDQGDPFVEMYREQLDKPMRVKVVARIKTFSKEVRFLTKDGAVLNKGGSLEADISAMGNQEKMKIETTFTHLPCDEA